MKSIEDNKNFILNIKTHEINFTEITSNYKNTEASLLETTSNLETEINKTNAIIGQFKVKTSFIDNTYEKITDNLENIDSAIVSIDAINKLGSDAKEVNTYSDIIKKKLSNIMNDANNTIKIIAGQSIAKHLNNQEKKESLAAKGWLILSGIFFIVSILFMIKGFEQQNIDWNFFAFKILVLPISLSALFFSMRQYIKRKNIVDSYAYKKTLALSLTGFKKQIDKSNSNEQTNYILKTIEILTESPLNDLDKNHIKNDLDSLEKMRESVFENIISTIKNQPSSAAEKNSQST